jgi:hypothetical protein
MKYTLILIALGLLLMACSRRGTLLTHQIAGVWQDESFKMTFNSDSGFSDKMIDGRGTNKCAGTWRVKNGFLTMALTNVNGAKPDGQGGVIVRLQIIDADARHITCLQDGRTNTFSR